MEKMKIEVWSDFMCPFCYIGKRRLEKSLTNSAFNDKIEIEWKSYLLNPDLVTDANLNLDEFLAHHKGMTIDKARELNQGVVDLASEEGLVYNLDKAVVANSTKAHVLSHFAKKYGKQNEVEELIFKAYFTDGKNIDDTTFLGEICKQVGLDAQQFAEIIQNDTLLDEVKMDIHESKQIGVRGVPFFVYDRKYGVSGAQPQEAFDQTLSTAFNEWKLDNINSTIQNTSDDGNSCNLDGCS